MKVFIFIFTLFYILPVRAQVAFDDPWTLLNPRESLVLQMSRYSRDVVVSLDHGHGRTLTPLAREALLEKRRYSERIGSLEQELAEMNGLVDQYQEDIRQLEDKLRAAREKQRLLVQRHIHANKKRRAQEDIRRMESSEAIVKFEEFENRIERMEAEADLVNYGRKPALEVQFQELMVDAEIEKELQTLKSTMKEPFRTE